MCQGRYSTFDIRVRAVEAVERGLPVGQVAETFGIDRTTLFRWLQKFETNGYDGLQRQAGSGRRRLLDDLTEEQLRRIVLFPASDFGYETDLWTVGRLRDVIEELYEVTLSKNTVWRRLRDAGLTYQKPERQYFEADEDARQEWLRSEVPRNPPNCAEIQGHSLFSGRIQRFADGLPGQNVGPLWADTSGADHRQERRSIGDVGPERSRPPPVSSVRQTHLLRGSHRFSGSDVAIS